MDDIAMVLNTLNDMADLMDSSLGDLVLMPNRHYKIIKGVLYLDIFHDYRLLSSYVRKFNADIYLTDRSSFIAQLDHKEYVIQKATKSDKIIPGKKRIVVGINIELAAESKIVLDNFGGK
jgi:hypothetical protein